MREQMGQTPHQPHPGPEHGESENQRAAPGEREHENRILEPQRHERAEPEADM